MRKLSVEFRCLPIRVSLGIQSYRANSWSYSFNSTSAALLVAALANTSYQLTAGSEVIVGEVVTFIANFTVPEGTTTMTIRLCEFFSRVNGVKKHDFLCLQILTIRKWLLH